MAKDKGHWLPFLCFMSWTFILAVVRLGTGWKDGLVVLLWLDLATLVYAVLAEVLRG